MSALDTQVAGNHYRGMAIQPVEFIHKNGIPFIEGCCIKYLCRWRDKGGIEDLRKVKHFVDLLMELEESPDEASTTPDRDECPPGYRIGCSDSGFWYWYRGADTVAGFLTYADAAINAWAHEEARNAKE